MDTDFPRDVFRLTAAKQKICDLYMGCSVKKLPQTARFKRRLETFTLGRNLSLDCYIISKFNENSLRKFQQYQLESQIVKANL